MHINRPFLEKSFALISYLGKYPKKNTKFLRKYPFGIRFYLGNDVLGFLSVWEIMGWEKFIWENILLS